MPSVPRRCWNCSLTVDARDLGHGLLQCPRCEAFLGTAPSVVPKRPESRSLLPIDAAARKNVPVYSGFLKYFPLAVAAVAELSRLGNDQHNPGSPLHWDRTKSGDELDADARHLLEAGTFDTDGARHSVKHAWRAMANLQKELEAAQAAGEPFFTHPTGDQT